MKAYLGFVLALLAVPVWSQAGKVGTGRYDQQIQDEVTKTLNSKDKWKQITATTDDAIVTLEGSAKIYMDKLDAGKKVGRLDHVNGVRNHVQVSTTVEDAQLQQQLADKLRYDRVGQGILFNNLNLKVQDGVVTVGGQVIDYPSRDSALAIVETSPGVKDVVDDIDVLPPSPMDDELRIRVARAVYGQPALNRYAIDPQKPIRIVVKNGHVGLYGVVDSESDKNIAGIQAKGVPGVFSVDNNLMVSNTSAKK
ncbi:MAG TPA: BON domain-containing protein [Terriglobales bacterium]|jgi:osmotically-inducible protein OsmY